eukprot:2350739-Prymnesium_polylepis.1
MPEERGAAPDNCTAAEAVATERGRQRSADAVHPEAEEGRHAALLILQSACAFCRREARPVIRSAVDLGDVGDVQRVQEESGSRHRQTGQPRRSSTEHWVRAAWVTRAATMLRACAA